MITTTSSCEEANSGAFPAKLISVARNGRKEVMMDLLFDEYTFHEPDEFNTLGFETVAAYPASEFVYNDMWTLLHPLHTCPLFGDKGMDQPSIMLQGCTRDAWS